MIKVYVDKAGAATILRERSTYSSLSAAMDLRKCPSCSGPMRRARLSLWFERMRCKACGLKMIRPKRKS